VPAPDVSTQRVASLQAMLAETSATDPFPENWRIKRYLECGCPYGAPLPLALGESWEGAPRGLRQHLLNAPDYTDGYQLDRYGLPQLRAVLAGRFAGDYGDVLEPAGIVIGVTWTGTRSVMSAFGTWLRTGPWRNRPTYITFCTPSWDYAGVFKPLGFIPNPVPLGPLPDCPLDVALLRDSLAALPADAANLIVINAQHNPTARNWTVEELEALIGAITPHHAVLVDDAYLGLTDWGVAPSKALPMVLRETDATACLLVRSLGKQFSCNGWSIGAYAARPAVMDAISAILSSRCLVAGARNQWALAQWLMDPSSDAAVRARRERLADNRKRMLDGLMRLPGMDPSEISQGAATPFVTFKVPGAYRGSAHPAQEFLDDCAARGIVLSQMPDPGILRTYIGGEATILNEALERMAGIARLRAN